MAETATAETQQDPSILDPGEERTFVYVGEMIPNQVLIRNFDMVEAQYWLQSGLEGWRYWGTVPPNETVSIMVEWFDGTALFHNGSGEASIGIGGDGIFPQGEEPA